MFPILDILRNNDIKINNLEKLLDQLLDIFIKKHTLSKKAHEELVSMSHLDSDIADIFHKREIDTTKAIILEQRAQYRLNGGYGAKSTGYGLKSLTNVGQSGLYPSERQYGRYIWISGNTTSAAGAYSADIELVNFNKENLTYLFMDYTNSIENTSYRTLSITNNLELSLQRTQTTSCTATWWEQIPIDLTNYNSIEFEITMNQPGDSSKLYDNIIGIRKYYPGQTVQAGEMLPSFYTEPISNYDVNYDKYILLGNDVFEKKKITLDISDIQGDNFLKVTAGNAGFIIHSIKLKK